MTKHDDRRPDKTTQTQDATSNVTTRQEITRQDMTRHDKTKQDNTRQDTKHATGQDTTREDRPGQHEPRTLWGKIQKKWNKGGKKSSLF